MVKSKVAVLETKPSQANVIKDYDHLIRLADYEKVISNKCRTILKLNLSWNKFFPACPTMPWQLEGVLKALRNAKCKDIIAVENQTVATHPWIGAYHNKWLPIFDKYEVKFQPLTDLEWITYKPKAEMLAMYDIFDEILVPRIFFESNVIHLPTMKTHGHTVTTGAIKSSFGGLIPKYRHHAHLKIHEILVDLLAIQKEIHKGIFAVMDGCICGNGAGPKTLEPFIGNLILASEDQVAIDAVSAKIMGFDPLEIGYIKMAHDRCLGVGDIDQIDVVGIEKTKFEKMNFGFEAKISPVLKMDKILRRKTIDMGRLHKFMFCSPLFRALIFAAVLYYDWIWYPFIGKRRIRNFMKTDWGKLFKLYEYGKLPAYRRVKDWDNY